MRDSKGATMTRLVGAFAFACATASAAVWAQDGAKSDEPPLKTTYVRLGNNANAIVVEPITPDPARARFALLVAHPERVNTFGYFIGRELPKRGYRVMMVNYY